MAECLWKVELGAAEAIDQRAREAGLALKPVEVYQALGRLTERQILEGPLKEAEFYEFVDGLTTTGSGRRTRWRNR